MLNYEALYKMNLISHDAWRLYFLCESADKMTSLHRTAVILQTSKVKFNNIESPHVAAHKEAPPKVPLQRQGHPDNCACNDELV